MPNLLGRERMPNLLGIISITVITKELYNS
jgi:hypothetical protein